MSLTDLATVKPDRVLSVAELCPTCKFTPTLARLDIWVAGLLVDEVLVNDPAAAADTPTVIRQLPPALAVTPCSVMVPVPSTAVSALLTSTEEQVAWGVMAPLIRKPEARVSVKLVMVSALAEELLVMVIVKVVA